MSPNSTSDSKAGDKQLTEHVASKNQQQTYTDNEMKFELRSIGVGTMRTSATYAALLIQLEGERWEQICVLDSLMEALGISPEEVLLNRQRPGSTDGEAFDRWSEAMDDLELRAKANIERDKN